MYPLCAPTASPPIITPSITECGSCSKISRSLQVPGSLSSPLHNTYFGFADCLGTNDHFIPVENPAPPRPHGLVAVQFEITVDVGRTQAKAPGYDLHLVGMGNQRSHLVIW